jgi:hypothetical protein
MLEVTVPPTTNDLTILGTAQRELVLGQAALTGIPELITAASEAVAQYCGRLNDDKQSEFGAQTVRQTERSVYRDCILLDRDLAPVITSVVEDGTTLSASDYELDGARLFRLDDDTRIAWCAAKVVITYTTGWTLLGGMPQPIEQATLDVLRDRVARRGIATNVRSESVDGVMAISYRDPKPEDGGLPAGVADLLKPWRRWSL